MDLEILWQQLETNFPLGGTRRHLQDNLGIDVVAALERAGILKQRRLAETYPCPGPRNEECPRQVIEIDGEYLAVCGNNSADCADIILTPADIALLAVDPISLCRGIAKALQIYAKAEPIGMIVDAFRVGTFIPEPGVKHAVFFVVRTSARRYAEAIEALRSRQDGDPFAVLMPTDRFLTDDVGCSIRYTGLTVLALAEVIGLSNGRLAALADPLRLFAGLGQKRAPFGLAPEIVAQALVRNAAQPPRWVDLHQQGYEDLLTTADQYDVFADERDRSVRKKSGECHRGVLVSYFRSIRAAVTKTGRFDPNVEGPDMTSGKQIFQRARAIFDMKSGKSSWRIFPSIKTGERHTVYRFSPDADVSFAFIFLPE